MTDFRGRRARLVIQTVSLCLDALSRSLKPRILFIAYISMRRVQGAGAGISPSPVFRYIHRGSVDVGVVFPGALMILAAAN